MRGNCRSCGDDIFWARTEYGQWMPLNPEPTVEGSVVILPGSDDEIARVETKEEKTRRLASEPAVRFAFVPHWVTCPDAARWRKKEEAKL